MIAAPSRNTCGSLAHILLLRPGAVLAPFVIGSKNGIEAQWTLLFLWPDDERGQHRRAPVQAFLPELLADVLAGRLDPSPVLDLTADLAGVPAGYMAMDQRQAMKVMVRP